MQETRQRGVRRRWGIMLAIAAFIVGGAIWRQAIGEPGRETAKELKAAHDMIIAHDAILRVYWKGDYGEAKLALEQIVAAVEKAAPESPGSAATLFYLTYSRLYLLEKRTGHDAAAKANMVKLRYWWLRGGELLKRTPEETMADIEEYSSDKHIEKMIDNMDESANDGKRPHYREAIK